MTRRTRVAQGPGRGRLSLRPLRKAGPLLGFAAALALLAGCVTGPDEPPPAPAKAAESAPAPPAETPTEPFQAPLRTEIAALPPSEPEKIYPPPASLMGLVPGQVTALLGPPPFRRVDEPAEVWQYRNGNCVLDLFLYRRPQGGHIVAHYETRTLGETPVAPKACFRALLKAHEGRGAG